MSLHAQLAVNGHGIGATFYARRREHLDLRSRHLDDAVSTYDVIVVDSDGQVWRGVVRHRYGDGAWALVLRALLARQETDDIPASPPATPEGGPE